MHPHNLLSAQRRLGALSAMAFAALPLAAHGEVSISTHKTKNMVCQNGVCSPTAKGAFLNVNELQKLLKSGDVKVTTGSGAVTMGVDSPLTWTNGSRLTLDAAYNVAIKAQITVAGTGALTIVYSDGVKDGDLKFFPGGKIDFWDLGSSLSIEGTTYTLENDIVSLAKAIKGNQAGSYALANDYDAGPDGAYDSSAIRGTFDGAFEGLGHSISNLVLTQQDCLGGGHLGFFAKINTTAVVRDIALNNAAGTSCTGYDLGLLVASNYGTIRGVSVSGSLQSTGKGKLFSIGGVAGANIGGTIARASSTATIDSDIRGWSAIGGLVGWSNGTIALSKATGNVSGTHRTLIGGLAGYATAVDQSYATGSVIGGKGQRPGVEAVVGGLVGSGSGITNSYSFGAATSGDESDVGGLLGVGGDVSSSYSTGAPTGAADDPIGGFIGDNTEGASSSYWDLDTSGISDPGQGCGNEKNCAGVTGLTDAQLKSGLPDGFDPQIWGQDPDINNGYPYLLANPPPQ